MASTPARWRNEWYLRAGRARLGLDTARDLLALCQRHQSACEAECNWWDGPEDSPTRPTTVAERRIDAYLAARLPGWTVRFDGDPRGATVYLYAPGDLHAGRPGGRHDSRADLSW